MAAGDHVLAGARVRATYWLREEIEGIGQSWRPEFEPLSQMIVTGIQENRHPREVARHLGNEFRHLGLSIDAEGLVLTEFSLVRCVGAWEADLPHWDEDTLVFRQSSAYPCVACLQLYRNPDGTPKLYRVAAVDVPGARHPNVGPRRDWTAKIGPTHRTCTCAPWSRWHPAMQPLFERSAPKYAVLFRELARTKRKP